MGGSRQRQTTTGPGRRRSGRGARALAALGCVVGGALAHVAPPAMAAGAAGLAEAADCTPWWGQTSLQSAVDANRCTEIQPGEYIVNAYLVIPDGHELRGDPDHQRDEMVVRAGRPWNGNGYEAVVNGAQHPSGERSVLRHFVVDAARVSTGGVGVRAMVVDDMEVRGARCWGIAVVGPGMSVTDSVVEGNGSDPACPSPPGAGIFVAANGVEYAEYAPVIVGNDIRANTGPGVDVYNVGRGEFRDNRVQGNSGWAGFSLFGSNWTVTDNEISHPTDGVGQPWIPSCAAGPAGARPAAAFLCLDTVSGGRTTAFNVIARNALSSFYGVLLIGNDEASSAAVPGNNVVAANDVRATVPCADDNVAAGPTANFWTGCTPTWF